MAGISQIIRWRQGRAVVSNRSAPKARSGDTPASASAQPAPASTKVSLSGTTPAGASTYLDKLKRKAKADARLNATRVQAAHRQTQATSGSVPAPSAAGATMQQSLRDALSTFAALAEPVAMTSPTPPDPPRGPAPPSLPPQTADVAVSWDPDPTYDLHAQVQEARARKDDEAAAAAESQDAGEAPPTPAAT